MKGKIGPDLDFKDGDVKKLVDVVGLSRQGDSAAARERIDVRRKKGVSGRIHPLGNERLSYPLR